MTTNTELDALADLLADVWESNSVLLDHVIGADSIEDRDRAEHAIRCNTRTAHTVASYLADPPSFSWFLHRESVKGTDGVVFSIHT